MIPVCFPQEITLGYDDGSRRRFLACSPELTDNGRTTDPNRIYLSVEETFQGISRDCLNSGVARPVRLPDRLLADLAGGPQPLAALLAGEALAGRQLKVCLVNGGGGGLGDGILFAPALDILSRRLFEMTGRVPQLVVYSMLPQRTGAVLAGIPGVRVKAMPLSLAEFLAYDASVDFTGMLTEADFQGMHMTDFALRRMGIDPEGVPAAAKEPLLNLAGEAPPAAAVALALARRRAGQRPLVAVVFISAYTRTLPSAMAAELISRLQERFQPVIMMPEGHDAAAFIAEHGLADTVIDLTSASRSFLHFFALLAGMDAIISVDTSAVHVGAALGKPTIGLFNSIDKELRVRYSPTVAGIQLAYRGSRCQAPCGLSKARAYLEGRLPDNTPFRLECGYACDEAVAREQILAEAAAAIRGIDPAGNVKEQYAAIRQATIDRLHAALAPCWQALDPEEVVARLASLLAGQTGKQARRCPVCDTAAGRHSRVWGEAWFSCPGCGALFVDPACGREEGEPHGPAPTDEEQRFLSELLALPAAGSRLLAVASEEEWWQASWRPLLEELAEHGRELSFRSSTALAKEAVPGAEFDAVIVAGTIDLPGDPPRLGRRLLARMRPGAVLVLITLNRQNPEQGVADSGAFRPGKGGRIFWQAASHAVFLKNLGLEPLWSGTTPLTWESVATAAGELPAFRVQPSGRAGSMVQVAGSELGSLVAGHLAQVLQNIAGHGRFLISVARRE